jgi:hypothetical protein
MPELADRAEPRALGDDARSSGVRAAVSSNTSPPTKNAIPPMLSGSASGRPFRSWITGAAALTATVEKEHTIPVASQDSA